jgi:hypothetical protein
MIGLPSKDLLGRVALALCAAGALSTWIGCASDPPPPPPALEVLRTTNEDGSVRYTIRRNRIPDDARTPAEGGTPDGAEPAPSGGDVAPDDGARAPGDQIRDQLESDREFLRKLISRNAPEGFERTQDPKLREIAERLPRLQAELEALENEPEP